jgi:hypothetical protein
MLVIGPLLLAGCSFSDPALDKQIDRYRGTGIQQQGNAMPPHEIEDLED